MFLLKFLWWTCVALVCGVLLSVSGAYLYLSPNLPSVDALRNVQLQIPLRIYSHDEKLIAEFGEMRRAPIRIQDVPADFINALLSAEDDNFVRHHGVDLKSLARATVQLIQTGHIQTGGSTITMQVAKNYFLTNERSFSRKLNEILLALQIERELTKDEILELYINKIYLGNRAYGIQAAAQVYYGKSIEELSLAQLAMIAGLPKAPSRFNPLYNPERSKERRDWILERMLKLGLIDRNRYNAAVQEPIGAAYHVQQPELIAPYIAEMARAEMVGRYGSNAYTEGFKVYTTVTSELQQIASKAVRDGLIEYDRRHGYRGPEARFPDMDSEGWQKELEVRSSIGGLYPAIVTRVDAQSIEVLVRLSKSRISRETLSWDTMKWARPYLSHNSMGASPRQPSQVVKVGDLIRVKRQDDEGFAFTQIPAAQSALVSLDPTTGSIVSLVGGFSFDQSNYNRATQAKRQPGSSFKPFIYSAALDNGYTASTFIDDAPVVLVDEWTKEVWRPKNDSNTYLGPMSLRAALYRSRNMVSIRILQGLTIQPTLQYLMKFGFKREDLPPNFSLALGTAAVTPLEIASAWCVFANGGYRIEPYLIERIDSRDGETLFQANPARVPENPVTQDVSMKTDPLTGAIITSRSTDNDTPVAEQVIDPRTAYIMTSILQDVIKRGTGRRALVLKRTDLAGKTGTTNESKDGWFSGYNSDLVTSVWVGFDQPETLGRREYGGTVALPIWIKYMGEALEGKPSHTMAEPPGIIKLRIDPENGRSASPDTPGAYYELFKNELTPSTAKVPSLGSDFYVPSQSLPGDEDAPPIDLF